MAAKSGLNRSIADQAWGLFRKVLTDKAEEAGRSVLIVNPAYTSHDCSRCGQRQGRFEDRTYHCQACGMSLDRDIDAARNILIKARRGPAGPEPAHKHPTFVRSNPVRTAA